MIVEIKLSIPQKHRDNARYHIQQLEELARIDYPGYVIYKYPGLQGATKRYPKEGSSESTFEHGGKLFS